jgi:hypothetical protein
MLRTPGGEMFRPSCRVGARWRQTARQTPLMQKGIAETAIMAARCSGPAATQPHGDVRTDIKGYPLVQQDSRA